MIRQTPITCTGHSRPVVDIEFSDITDDGSYYLISASKDGKPQLREGGTGDWLGTFEGHKGAIWAVDISYDGTRAVTGAADFMANYWDAETGSCLASCSNSHIVKSVAINFEKTLVLAGTSRNRFSLFDVRQPVAAIEEYEGHTGSIKGLHFMQNNDYVISAAEDRTIKMWDRRNNCDIRTHTVDSPIADMSVREGVLTVSYGSCVGMHDIATFDILRTNNLPGPINSASLHPDQKYYVCGGQDFYVYKIDIETGSQMERYKKHFGPVHCVRYSPDGEVYATGSEDGTVRLWQNTVGKTYGLWQTPDLTNCHSPNLNEFSM